MSSFTTINNVFSFLLKEYGYLLPELSNCKTINNLDIPLTRIIFTPQRLNEILEKNLDCYKNIKTPIILYKSHKKGSYQLIDGHHRYALALLNKKQQINAIILE